MQTAIARGVATAAGLDRNTAVQIGVDLALQRPNSRQDEFEADRRGPRGRAGCPIRHFLYGKVTARSLPTFLSTIRRR